MKALIDAYLENQKQKITKDIQTLVRIESIYGDNEGTRKALGFVMQKAVQMGMPCQMTREEDVLLVRIGSGEEKVGVLVHVDVVEIGDRQKWTHPPFGGHFDGENIWGRGTLDDKGAVIVCLYVLKALLDLKINLNKQIWLIVGSAEEGGGWSDIEHFKRDFGVPDYGFSPDGDFPIFNEENGYVDVELYFAEPKLQELVLLRSGESVNTIPSKAVIQFRGQSLMEFHGLSAHSSTPELGENAIEILCRQLTHRQDLNFIRFINNYLSSDLTGDRLGLNPQISGQISNSATRKTICVPTVLRLTEKGVCLNVNIRHKFGVNKQDILQRFEKYAGEYGYSLRTFNYLEPMLVDENHKALKLMSDVYEESGLHNSFKVGYGTSYAKAMENFVSWGPNFPEVVNCAHMENEKVSLDSLMSAAKMYTLFLAKCATGSSLGGSNPKL